MNYHAINDFLGVVGLPLVILYAIIVIITLTETMEKKGEFLIDSLFAIIVLLVPACAIIGLSA